MKFSTENIKKNLKTVSSINSEFVYIDVADSKLYLSSDNQAIQLDIVLDDVQDDEKKIFVIEKNDFLHIANFTDVIYLDKDYKYYSEDRQIKGKFAHNDNYADVLDSVKVMFTDTDYSYREMFTINNDILVALMRGSIFVNENDIKSSMQNLNIQNNHIFSSSDFRIYLGIVNSEISEGIIHASVLKYMTQLGIGTKVYNNDNSYLLRRNEISIYLSTMSDVDYLPVLDPRFQSKYTPLFETNRIIFKVEELLNKLNFISFYAKNSPSNLAFLTYKDGNLTLSTTEDNHVSIQTEGIDMKDEELRLPFNAISMQNIVSKLGKPENNVSLYVDSKDDVKLFILEFSKDEIVILSKINA